MNGCNVIKDKKIGNLEIKVVPNAPHGFDEEAYAEKNSRVGITKVELDIKLLMTVKPKKLPLPN